MTLMQYSMSGIRSLSGLMSLSISEKSLYNSLKVMVAEDVGVKNELERMEKRRVEVNLENSSLQAENRALSRQLAGLKLRLELEEQKDRERKDMVLLLSFVYSPVGFLLGEEAVSIPPTPFLIFLFFFFNWDRLSAAFN